MAMEMKLSQQDRILMKKLTKSLDNLAISLGKRQPQAPKSPKRLSEPEPCCLVETPHSHYYAGETRVTSAPGDHG